MAIKPPRGFWRAIGAFWFYVLGGAAVRFGYRQLRGVWARAHHVTYRKDTFDRACKRHKITPEKLERIATAYRQQKDICFVSLIVGISFWILGTAWGDFYILLGSALAISVALMMGFIATFRMWQIKTRKLGGQGGSPWTFVADGHHWQMFALGPFTRMLVILYFVLTPAFFASPALAPAADGVGAVGTGMVIRQADNDPSKQMLGGIIGSMQGWLGPENNLNPLSEAFLKFNLIVLAAGVFFFLYSATSAIVQTAHEGEFLGKRYHTVWWPIRTIIGVGGVTPIFKGFSAAQMIVSAAAVFGIGAANIVWSAGATAFATYIGNPIETPTVAVQDRTVQAIMQAQACMIGHNMKAEEKENPSPTTAAVGSQSGNSGGVIQARIQAKLQYAAPDEWNKNAGLRLVYGGEDGSGYSADACGGVLISDSQIESIRSSRVPWTQGMFDSPRDYGDPSLMAPYTGADLRKVYEDALMGLHNALLPITQSLVETGGHPDPAQVAAAQSQFRQAIASGLKGPIAKGGSDFSLFMQNEGKSWFLAGALYPKIAAINRQVMDAAYVEPAAIPQTTMKSEGMWLGANRIQGFLVSSGRVRDTAVADNEDAEEGKGMIADLISKTVSAQVVLGAVEGLLAGRGTEYRGDLFTTLPNVGYKLLSAATVGWVTAGGFGAFTPNAAGTLFAIFVVAILFPLAASGFFLAFYIPVLPFVVWYSGLLSWLVVVGEAIAAAPLWAIIHMDTQGEGMGDRTTYGYLFLVNLLFRPSLMVVGLIFGGVAVLFLGIVLKGGIGVLLGMGGIGFSGLPGLVISMGMVVLFVILATTTVTTAFSLVQIVPNQVIAWVGGVGSNVPQLAEEHTRAGVVAFGKGGQGAAGEQVREAHTYGRNQSALAKGAGREEIGGVGDRFTKTNSGWSAEPSASPRGEKPGK